MIKSIIIICPVLFFVSCSKIIPEEYIVENAFTITIKTTRGGIEFVPILKLYGKGSNEIVVVNEKDFLNIEVGDTVFVKNKNVIKVDKKCDTTSIK